MLWFAVWTSGSHWRFIKLINFQCTMPFFLALACNTASKALEATACSTAATTASKLQYSF